MSLHRKTAGSLPPNGLVSAPIMSGFLHLFIPPRKTGNYVTLSSSMLPAMSKYS